MSRLIFKGDTIKNFGEFFPAIFVEQVTVEDNSLLVQLALHVVINEDREVVDVLTELGDLSFYLMAVTDEDKISNIISRETNVFEVLFDLDLYDMDADTYSTLEATLTSPQVEEIKANLGEHEQLIIGEFEIAADDLYDDNGNKILRLTTEVAFTQMAEFGWDFFENISLFAFSSIINFSDSTSTEIDDKLEILPLLDNNISDIVYENVFKDGEIAGIQEVKWMDSSDAIFDAVPLQTIDAKYRKINQITHKDITDSFEQLLENSEQLAETNPTIKNAANSISNILTVYGSAADLIPRLNELRKAFPSKSSVTPLGRMYSQFKNKLMAANKSAMQGDTLNKRVVSNPVVVDNRQALSLEWSASDIDEVLLGSDYLYNKWYVDSQSIVKSGDTYAGYVSTGGFYFFDLEKYIHNASNLATIFNISKLEKLFGSGFVNSGFRISESYIERYSITDGSVATSPSVKITSTIGRNPVTTYIEISKTEGEAYAKIETEDDTEHSYLYIRNFGLANDETDTYRLAMFEFQDLYPESIVDTFEEPPSSYMYAGNVTISDVSENIAIAVTGSYYKYLAQVEKYKDIASEHCSYNNIDNHFNDFFVDNMVAAYSDDMENAPWIRGPIVYNIHRDLLFDEFGGDIDEILEASKKISDRIGPQAGTLERIEAFFNRYEALYDNHYTDTTDIADAVKDFQDSDGERSFGNWFSDIPLVYDNTLADELAAEAAAFADEQRSGRQESTMHSTVRELIQSISDWTDQYESLSSEVDDLLDEIGDKITSLDYSEATKIPLKVLEMYLIANVMAVEADYALAAVATGGTGLEEDLEKDKYNTYAKDLVIAYAKLAKVEEGGWVEDALAEAGATDEEITAAYTKVIGASLITSAAATAAFWGVTIAVGAAWSAIGAVGLSSIASALVAAAGVTATTVVGIVVSAILLVVAGIVTLFALGKKDEAAETIVDLTEKIIEMTDASVKKSSGIASDAYTTYLDR
jgi:hypothetical protein